MLLKGDITMTIQWWESRPCHAGSKKGLASDRPCIGDKTYLAVKDTDQSGDKNRQPVNQTYIQSNN
jgi:hypothetical protein